ncbi:MAG: membrane integrity-associated transporter subunit PqiC [Proteobacteria bacterium]|nr:membrane integrity-associated transporter subunit PqiC [Pseudomonadota bacterium]
MNITFKSFIVAVSLPLILAGCGTTPASKFYLLSAEAGHFPSGSSPSLGVGPIEIPEYLNRNALVYNREGNRLHIANFERWAEPLDSSISRVIRLNLASLLDTQNVQSFPWSKSDAPQYGVEVTVLNLDANDQRARLVAEWHIYRAQKNRATILRRVIELDYTMSAGAVTAAEVAPAYSNLLLQLSEIIAAAISEDYASQNTAAANN